MSNEPQLTATPPARRCAVVAALAVAALLGTAALPTASSRAQAQSAAPAPGSRPQVVKLGLSGPFTGPQAQYGKDFQSGVMLALDDFNATVPTIGGKPVRFEVIALDDQADPKTGTVVAQRLVDEDIRGMIGHFNSGVSIPASAVYAAAGIPQVSMATAPAYTRQGYRTSFRMLTSDTQQGGVMGRYVVEQLKPARIAIIDDRSAYGQGLADEFEKAVKAAGGNIVAREFTNDKAFDFMAILTSLKGKDPDFLYYAGADAQSAPLLKQVRALALKGTFASGEMSKTDNFLKLAGPSAEGAIATLAGLPLQDMPGGRAFAERFTAKFGGTPGTYAPYAYDGTMALMKAMVKADSSDPKVYLPVLARTGMEGVTTRHFAYDERGDLRDAVVTVYRVDGGQWKPLQVIGNK